MSSSNDRGFTLIELMIVVLIVAILIAIAIPTFLGQRTSAEDAAAKSSLRNALTTEKAYFSGAEAFTDDLDILSDIEPSLFNVTGASPAINTFDPIVVTIAPAGQAVCLVAQTPRGEYLAIWEGSASGTQFGIHSSNPFGTCSAAGPPGVGSWSLNSW
ncbi:MAG: prepilin-type N-terminal cleavage/methylation domain-containing protein [Acidimicrobiia bacterium]|nr:prepilin-type N-terminal cleavage/methylation domain-containing protein [Acidimicrobiia bacterium]NNL14532.1 prepilin-type N-terminal cleavage/methylation domain-containing protein [Acidimicrobiia bacterium]